MKTAIFAIFMEFFRKMPVFMASGAVADVVALVVEVDGNGGAVGKGALLTEGVAVQNLVAHQFQLGDLPLKLRDHPPAGSALLQLFGLGVKEGTVHARISTVLVQIGSAAVEQGVEHIVFLTLAVIHGP